MAGGGARLLTDVLPHRLGAAAGQDAAVAHDKLRQHGGVAAEGEELDPVGLYKLTVHGVRCDAYAVAEPAQLPRDRNERLYVAPRPHHLHRRTQVGLTPCYRRTMRTRPECLQAVLAYRRSLSECSL